MNDLLLRLAGPSDACDAASADALRGLDAVATARLLDVASAVGLGGLAAHRLAAWGRGILPEPAPGVVEARRRIAVAGGMLLDRCLLRAVEALEARGVRPLAFKGVVLSRILYGETGFRDSEDTDLLVAPEELPRANEALASLGYRPLVAIPERSTALFRRKGHQVPWADGTGAVVDLHWSLAPPYDDVRFEEAGARERSVRVDIGGRAVTTLGDEDLLVYLCYHGCKSLWARLGWAADVARLLEVRPGLRGDEALRIADAVGARRMLLVGLLLARDLFGATLRGPLAEAAARDGTAAALAARFDAILSGRAPFPTEGGRRTLLHVRMREGAGRRLRYLRDLSFTPRPGDWERRAASAAWRAAAGLARGAAAALSVGAAALDRPAGTGHGELARMGG
jgi:hypothetical protein